jgi:predicted anti-sigma-YlaC factor YlaD
LHGFGRDGRRRRDHPRPRLDRKTPDPKLFRLYLTGVTVGVGLLIALATGFVLRINIHHLQSSPAFVYTVLLLVIPSSLAFFAYRNAAGFRGERPEFLNPISADEFS